VVGSKTSNFTTPGGTKLAPEFVIKTAEAGHDGEPVQKTKVTANDQNALEEHLDGAGYLSRKSMRHHYEEWHY
jgi:hypothetical protein